MQIRWEELEPKRFEDMVSVLLSRLNPDAQRIDGTGGDGGWDVQIVHGQDDKITAAFELKSFTGRMTPSRREQTARSLSPNPPMGGVKARQVGMREPTRERAWAPWGPM